MPRAVAPIAVTANRTLHGGSPQGCGVVQSERNGKRARRRAFPAIGQRGARWCARRWQCRVAPELLCNLLTNDTCQAGIHGSGCTLRCSGQRPLSHCTVPCLGRRAKGYSLSGQIGTARRQPKCLSAEESWMIITSIRGPDPRDDWHMSVNDDDCYAIWDAAYVLGSLSAADRREFETHLTHCLACRQAVDELAGIPALLNELDFRTATAIDDLGTSRQCYWRRPSCRRCGGSKDTARRRLWIFHGVFAR